MTQLRKRLLEEIERRNYSQATAHAYVAVVRRFAAYFHRSPDKLSLDHIREYQLHRLDSGIRPRTVSLEISALRFFYNKVRAAATRGTIFLCPALTDMRFPLSSAPMRSPGSSTPRPISTIAPSS